MSPLPPRPRFNEEPDSGEPVNVFEEPAEAADVAPSGLTRPRLSVTPPDSNDFSYEADEEELVTGFAETVIPNPDFLPTEHTSTASAEDIYGAGTLPAAHETPTYNESAHAEPETPETPTESSPVEDALELEEIERRKQISALSTQAKENAQRLLALISNDESSEVVLNGPNEIMYKVNGQRFFDKSISFASVEEYHTVINTLILYDTDTTERIGDNTFLIEGQMELPDYDNPEGPSLHARVHVLAPPVVKTAKVTIAKKAKKQFQIEDLQSRGAMSPQMAAFMKALGRGRATIVFSGLSGSGKTTMVEAMSYNFDENDRVIVVEDTAELRLPLADVVPLLSSTRKPGQDINDIVSLEWLVNQANRMRPDRIIVGEIRGGEIAEFLSAANSGADGSMTTVHASSPRQTIDKMLSLAMKSATAKNESSVLRDISSTVQIIVQMGLIDGKHIVTQIEEISDTLTKGGTGIQTQPIFQYDRNTNRFVPLGRPSDKLISFLAQRGVGIDNSWFARV